MSLRLSLSVASLFPPPSVSFSLSPVPSQTVQRNCYSQVIILFVRLHSAVNPLGIPLYSLLTLLQSSFSCQSQNIAEGEKRNRDKDEERGRKRRERRGHGNVGKKYQRNRETEKRISHCSYRKKKRQDETKKDGE